MIDFSNFTVTKTPVFKEEKINKGRYILGCDPAEVSDKGNVFIIYDKHEGRVTGKAITRLSFDKWVENFLTNEIDKKLYTVSNKFIHGTGRGKTIDEIRNENSITL